MATSYPLQPSLYSVALTRSGVLSTGLPPLDRCLPGGGWPLGEIGELVGQLVVLIRLETALSQTPIGTLRLQVAREPTEGFRIRVSYTWPGPAKRCCLCAQRMARWAITARCGPAQPLRALTERVES